MQKNSENQHYPCNTKYERTKRVYMPSSLFFSLLPIFRLSAPSLPLFSFAQFLIRGGAPAYTYKVSKHYTKYL